MFEFEIIQELKPNDEILEIIKSYAYFFHLFTPPK